jgi:hypothetical protein
MILAHSSKDGVAVSTPPPLSTEVEYFCEKNVSLHITNVLADSILLEDVTLQFQADTGSAPIYVDHTCGIELANLEVAPIAIPVTPTCQYLENTNVFKVMVHYRTHVAGQIGQRVHELHNGSYLIIRRPSDVAGDVFISFKQPEYLGRARLLERYARRAGLNPYLIIDDKQPGSAHWERIEEAIMRSKTAFIIWGERTEWGTGVQREVELCRRHGVREVLLLQEHLPVPELFLNAAEDFEYSRLNFEDPVESFSSATASARRQILTGRVIAPPR